MSKRTRYSLEKAKMEENNRWVQVLREEPSNLYMLMRQRAVPNKKKPRKTNEIPITEQKTREGATWTSRPHSAFGDIASRRCGVGDTGSGAPLLVCVVDRQLIWWAMH